MTVRKDMAKGFFGLDFNLYREDIMGYVAPAIDPEGLYSGWGYSSNYRKNKGETKLSFQERLGRHQERGLLAAVLQRAIMDLTGAHRCCKPGGGEDQRVVREAKEFFRCKDDFDPMCFTFIYICNELDLEPEPILAWLRSEGLLSGADGAI